jgi:predicted CXXCH cytochrome family protein
MAPMQVEVTFLTRRGADAIMRKSQTVTAEAIRFGRGTDNEVQLPDIRVGLRAAILAPREAGLVVERAGDEVLRVNGEGVSNATVHPGDKISMGPYEVVIVETPSGFDAALTVELVQPLGDALERLLSQSHIGLASGGWSKRRLAWTLFSLCVLFALIVPIAVYPFGTVVRSSRSVPALGSVDYVNLSWNAGSVSNPHRFFAQNCATCHRSAFASVPDSACMSCHADVGNHIPGTAESAVVLGSITAADVLSLTLTSTAIAGPPVTVNYTVTGTDTTAKVAAGLAAAVTANPAATTAGVSASASDTVVNFAGPRVTLRSATNTGATESVAILGTEAQSNIYSLNPIVNAVAKSDLGPSGPQLQSTRCAQCHEEHRGVNGLVIQAQALCVDCHARLAETAPKTRTANVGGFPSGHPQFRATLVVDAAKSILARDTLGTKPPPKDNPGLVFSHAAHLIKTGLPVPDGQKTSHKIMDCSDCHVPEPSGQGFQPITFEGQCHSCHDLKFDKPPLGTTATQTDQSAVKKVDMPWPEVPHGDPDGVTRAVENYYAHMALQGGVQDVKAPAFVRRPVGTPEQPTDAQAKDALTWAAQRSAEALSLIWDDKRGCAYCHVTEHSNGNFTVANVILRTRFLPEAKFDHSKHTAQQCTDCHDAPKSESSSDVLIPGVESCVTCHGGEHADLKTQSTCTSCHLFHRQEFGSMKTANATR